MTFCDFFGFSNSEEQKYVSGQQTHQLVILSLEAILGTKNQNKLGVGIFNIFVFSVLEQNKGKTRLTKNILSKKITK